jgi:hypothetical protein
MGASENKALVWRMFEQGMNEGRAEIFDECVAADFVNHDLPGPTPGPEGHDLEQRRATLDTAPARTQPVELPCPINEVLEGVDTVIVSHLRPDHFDEAAFA